MTDTGFSSRPKDYAPLGKALHWVSALIVLGIIPAGIVMTNIGPSPLQNQLFDLHRSFGVAIFALALWRLCRILQKCAAAVAVVHLVFHPDRDPAHN